MTQLVGTLLSHSAACVGESRVSFRSSKRTSNTHERNGGNICLTRKDQARLNTWNGARIIAPPEPSGSQVSLYHMCSSTTRFRWGRGVKDGEMMDNEPEPKDASRRRDEGDSAKLVLPSMVPKRGEDGELATAGQRCQLRRGVSTSGPSRPASMRISRKSTVVARVFWLCSKSLRACINTSPS